MQTNIETTKNPLENFLVVKPQFNLKELRPKNKRKIQGSDHGQDRHQHPKIEKKKEVRLSTLRGWRNCSGGFEEKFAMNPNLASYSRKDEDLDQNKLLES